MRLSIRPWRCHPSKFCELLLSKLFTAFSITSCYVLETDVCKGKGFMALRLLTSFLLSFSTPRFACDDAMINPSSPRPLLHSMANQHILPPEILQKIVSYLAGHQSALHVCTLVSTLWYKCAVPLLYSNPAIDGKNFDKFVRAICPSINAHVRVNGLAALVRRLDMSLLVHNGSKSLTARLLGRVKGNLEDFVAPQASFA